MLAKGERRNETQRRSLRDEISTATPVQTASEGFEWHRVFASNPDAAGGEAEIRGHEKAPHRLHRRTRIGAGHSATMEEEGTFAGDSRCEAALTLTLAF
mmetsp:Transcript_43703/g.100889  ORF Transcript_43703/g.100889 Transcript_43703/m.100889 type:complete len:99 (+) Transcript_43703:2885-3181(+)